MRRRHHRISQMNVVPYIDVMLVLLIIFMMTSPLLTQGVDVELPTVKQSQTITPEPKKLMIITLNAQGDLFLDDDPQPLSSSELLSRVMDKQQVISDPEVLVKGDSRLPYGEVVQVMDLLREAGLEKIGLLTKLPSSSYQRRKLR